MSDFPKSSEKETSGFLTEVAYEVFSSPLNLALVCVIAFLVYKIFKSHTTPVGQVSVEPELPPMKKRDFTLQELKKYDGRSGEERILIAVLGKVFDVTRGKRFYGPGGPYETFAGRDASRGLATFSVSSVPDDVYDDLSDLNTVEMDSVKEWEMQFTEKYTFVGRLLKPGQEPATYSDEEEDTPSQAAPQEAAPQEAAPSAQEKKEA